MRTALRQLLPLAIGVALVLAFSGTAVAAGPQWRLAVKPDADYFVPGPTDEQAFYTIEAENVGDAGTSNGQQITLEDVLPAGLAATGVKFYDLGTKFGDLSKSLCTSPRKCKFPGSFGSLFPDGVEPGGRLIMLVHVSVEAGLSGTLKDAAKISGGGALPAEATVTNEAVAAPLFSIKNFDASVTDASKATPYTQAGGHPYQIVTEINLATKTLESSPTDEGGEAAWGEAGITPVQDPRDLGAGLPPGLIGNPQAMPRCSLADFFSRRCPISTVIGMVGIRAFGWSQGRLRVFSALFNLQPGGQHPGEIGYYIGFPFLVTASVRSGTDSGIDVTNFGTPEVGLQRVLAITWGVPADPSHDALRGKTCASGWQAHFVESLAQVEHDCETEGGFGEFRGGPAGVEAKPYLTMPTECSGKPLAFVAKSNSWQEDPSRYVTATDATPAVDGCNALTFEPTIEARPTTNLADSPSGLEVHLHVPQNEDPEGVATPEVRDAVVKLPQGLVVNPASGDGQQGCTEAQVGFQSPQAKEEPAHCPDASKLGTVEVETPLLHNPLDGEVYLATPYQNPSGSLLAGYIVLEGEGVITKLAGEFTADHTTGQITARFLDNPQLPFEDFKFHFFEGARAALRTPPTCGTYNTTSVLTPFSAPESGPPVEPSSTFETTAGAAGGPCPSTGPEEPNAPVFHAGTESVQAGAYSPFSFRLVRADGSQEIHQIETTLPPGLVGKLAGVAECSDAQIHAAEAPGRSGAEEKTSPSCPLTSEVGVVDVASGAGPTPLHVPGRAYLAGPYRGAPLSLAIITPATAGPFDLGVVVVRTALYVNPETAQITAKSDQIPTILEGIPLDVRSITLEMNRPQFTLNPTDCEPLSVGGSALTVWGQAAAFSQPFQVGGCSALGFKPKLALSLNGKTRRAGFPALTATLTMNPGEANIAAAQVTLPHSAFLAQGHLDKTCRRPELESHSCPARSIYGHARAITPLLDKPLEGNVYLVTGFGYELPALVADLNGQIEVHLVGKVDTGREDGIRNTFEVVPDAPVSKFTLRMAGGQKGLIENHENLCAKHAKRRATALFSGQNGKSVESTPLVKVRCGKSKAKHRRSGRRSAESRRSG